MDLRLRGGTVMISRRVRPLSTSASAYAIASTCQLGKNSPPPDTIGNDARMNE